MKANEWNQRCKYNNNLCVEYSITIPLGRCCLACCSDGLHYFKPEDPECETIDLSIDVSLTKKDSDGASVIHSPAEQAVNWLRTYFNNPESIEQCEKPALCPSICSPNGTFLEKVWLTLEERVKVGSTVTYSELAELSGHPRAAQAVGSAMRRNPFHLIVPCHRVVKAGGQTGAYCGGRRNSVKQWLLDYEKRILERQRRQAVIQRMKNERDS